MPAAERFIGDHEIYRQPLYWSMLPNQFDAGWYAIFFHLAVFYVAYLLPYPYPYTRAEPVRLTMLIIIPRLESIYSIHARYYDFLAFCRAGSDSVYAFWIVYRAISKPNRVHSSRIHLKFRLHYTIQFIFPCVILSCEGPYCWIIYPVEANESHGLL